MEVYWALLACELWGRETKKSFNIRFMIVKKKNFQSAWFLLRMLFWGKQTKKARTASLTLNTCSVLDSTKALKKYFSVQKRKTKQNKKKWTAKVWWSASAIIRGCLQAAFGAINHVLNRRPDHEWMYPVFSTCLLQHTSSCLSVCLLFLFFFFLYFLFLCYFSFTFILFFSHLLHFLLLFYYFLSYTHFFLFKKKINVFKYFSSPPFFPLIFFFLSFLIPFFSFSLISLSFFPFFLLHLCHLPFLFPFPPFFP